MKQNILLKTLLIACGIAFSCIMSGQEIQGQTYSITNNGTVSNIQPYIDAMNNSDMKYHRLRNTRTTIIFETGVSVELFSAAEINGTVRVLDISAFLENFPLNRDLPVFSLGPNNFIMEQHNVTSKYH